MAKPNVPQTDNQLTENLPEATEDKAFEMIELAISDIDLLTKAFSMISDICAEERGEQIGQSDLEEVCSERVIH